MSSQQLGYEVPFARALVAVPSACQVNLPADRCFSLSIGAKPYRSAADRCGGLAVERQEFGIREHSGTRLVSYPGMIAAWALR